MIKKISVWDKVAKEFSQNGPNYWSWFGKELVKYSSLEEGHKVLDIGFGRGASLFPGREIVGEQGLVYGLDTSEEMVNQSKQDNDYSNVFLTCSDLENYTVSKNHDQIYCGFGLAYLEANKINYERVHELLKNTGQFALSVWTHQEDQDGLTALVNKHLKIENTPKHNSHMTTEFGVKGLLEKAGFVNVQTKLVEKTFLFKSKEEWWQDLNASAVKNILDVIDEKANLMAFKEEAFEALNQYKKKDGIHIKREAILIYCKKRKSI